MNQTLYNPFKYEELAKKRRNFVLNNLYQNKYINKKELKAFKNERIKLKKRKIELVNEANSYLNNCISPPFQQSAFLILLPNVAKAGL